METDPTAPKPKVTAESVKRKSPGDTLLVPKRIKKDSPTAQISATNSTNTGFINLTKKSEQNRAEVEKLRKEKKSVQKVITSGRIENVNPRVYMQHHQARSEI